MISNCPFCGAEYGSGNIRPIVGHASDHLVHVLCAICHRSMMISIVRKEGGLACAGVFTDCLYPDAAKFAEATPITADDVILTHTGFSLDRMIVLQ
jgi:hypothetical protein